MFLSVGGVTNINGVELYVDVTSGTTVDLGRKLGEVIHPTALFDKAVM